MDNGPIEDEIQRSRMHEGGKTYNGWRAIEQRLIERAETTVKIEDLVDEQ